MSITEILTKLTNDFIIRHNLKSAYYINCGLCEEWAQEAERLFPKSEVEGTPEDYWGNYEWAVGHVWIWINGLCYDSETLQGVEDWKDLTVFVNARKRVNKT